VTSTVVLYDRAAGDSIPSTRQQCQHVGPQGHPRVVGAGGYTSTMRLPWLIQTNTRYLPDGLAGGWPFRFAERVTAAMTDPP